jgi:hypothetical protein
VTLLAEGGYIRRLDGFTRSGADVGRAGCETNSDIGSERVDPIVIT